MGGARNSHFAAGGLGLCLSGIGPRRVGDITPTERPTGVWLIFNKIRTTALKLTGNHPERGCDSSALVLVTDYFY